MASELVEKLTKGDKRALARLLTLVEGGGVGVPDLMNVLHPYTDRAYTIGITGPPGAGKSTLVDQIVYWLRKDPKNPPSIGILAADPTSPFTGGAILADRIRMQRHYQDPGVFIRSMATRGSHGGLPRTARRAVKLLDAYGADIIIVETVGVGQAELDIMEVADTVVVVLVPEGGDMMQAMKAGLMEIADVFVINKSDRPGADIVVNDVKAMLQLDKERKDWDPPVIAAQGHKAVGIDQLVQAIESHRKFLSESGRLLNKRKERRTKEFYQAIRELAEGMVQKRVVSDQGLASLLEQVESNEIDSYSAALQAVEHSFS